ncbi:MAG: hypothetical protein KAG97_11695 [Victivallales bacterium]|nr:hypothetical protein [Victivallales bacterium]
MPGTTRYKDIIGDDLPDFSMDLVEETIEKTNLGVSATKVRKSEKKRMLFIEQMRTIRQALPDFPEPGWAYHIVNDSKYDFYTILPLILEREGTIEECYISTWTMNRENVTDLADHIKRGRIKKMAVTTGLYFKRRDPATYHQLFKALNAAGHRYVAFKNHTKILLAKTKANHLVIEGSANFASNPNLEQYVINNDPELYDFHKEWMDRILPEKPRP